MNLIEKNIESLKKEIISLKLEIKRLKSKENDEIPYMLKRRGFKYISGNQKTNLIFFNNGEDEIYQLMKRYSFRIFMRDLIKHRESFTIDDLIKYCSKKAVKGYLDILMNNNIIRCIEPSRYRITSDKVYSFGDTLEWFIAKIFEREFRANASWGIKLRGTESGGDFDVIASVEGNFIYVEVKSAPPKHIEISDIMAFLKRIYDLKPDISIFFEDTQLRMMDKIVPLFEESLENMGIKSDIKRLKNELFLVGNDIFIINSDPDIISNISFSLKYYLRGENERK
jgi:Holliday junction resolvase